MTNDPNNGEEVQEEVTVEETQTQEEKSTTDKPTELTKEQKEGIAKRNIKKYREEYPDLFNGESEETKPEEKPEEKETKYELSPKDFKALLEVDEEDWDEVQDYAKWKNISISDAKEKLKTTLEENAEFRKTEQAKNTTKNKQSETLSGSRILKEAEQGNIPKAGTKEAEALFKARRGLS